MVLNSKDNFTFLLHLDTKIMYITDRSLAIFCSYAQTFIKFPTQYAHYHKGISQKTHTYTHTNFKLSCSNYCSFILKRSN